MGIGHRDEESLPQCHQYRGGEADEEDHAALPEAVTHVTKCTIRHYFLGISRSLFEIRKKPGTRLNAWFSAYFLAFYEVEIVGFEPG